MKKRVACLCHKIIVSGVIGLVAFTPVAIGTVHVWAFTVMEIVVICLVIAWMTKLLCQTGESVEESPGNREGLICNISRNGWGFVKTPLNIPFLIFACIVLFQIVPLPSSVIQFLSPETHEIYSNYLPAGGLASMQAGKLASWQAWRTISINPHSTRIELFKVLSYVTVFFLIVNNFKTRREINCLIIAIILVGSFEAVYGFYEYSTGNKHILFLSRKYISNRLAGTYVNPNHLAGLLEMVVPAAIAFALCRKEGVYKNKPPVPIVDTKGLPFSAKVSLFFSKRNFANIVLFIFIGFLVGAIFLSQSRFGVVGFLVSIWLFGLYAFRRYYKTTGRVIVFSGLLGILFFASWMGFEPLYKRFSATSELTVKMRTDIWKDTGGIVKDFPIFGAGKGTFVDIYPKYRTFSNDFTYYHAHNDYLELISEMGLLGLAVTVIGGGFFAYKIIHRLTKRRNTYVKHISAGLLCSLAAIVIHSVTDFNMFIPANALLFSTILALLVLTVHLTPPSRPSVHGRNTTIASPFNKGGFRGIIRKPLFALIIPLAIFLSIPVLKACMADANFKRANAIETNAHASIPYLQKCISLDEKNGDYHYALGMTYYRLAKEENDPDEFERLSVLAAEKFEDAIITNPCNSMSHLLLGFVYGVYRINTPPSSELDKLSDTERSYLQNAVTLNPTNYSINYMAGYAYLKDWDSLLQEGKETALKYLRTAIELNPDYFNKVLQSSWRYIRDYKWLKRIIPQTPKNYMKLAMFFDEKRVFTERNITWEEARRLNGEPFRPPIFEDDNLIVNGSFEYEPGSAWDDWQIREVYGAYISVDNTTSAAGNNSLKIVFDGTKDVNFGHVIQKVKVNGGAKYLLTGYIRTKNITSKSGIRMVLSSKTLRKDTEPFLGTHDWTSFTIDFDAPEDCDTVNITVYRKGLGTVKKELISGTVWIDGLQLFERQ